MANGYLVEIDDQKREHEAIRILFEVPFIYIGFFAHFGLNPCQSWYLIEIREHYFTGSINSEVDIIAGRLELESSKINWSQSTKYLVGIEVKCAYLHPQTNQIKSQKSSPKKMSKIRSKIEELVKLGFDKVALLDIIANPPASGHDGQAWFNALGSASTSREVMWPVLQRRLQDNIPAEHWVWSIGSVIGGNETMRGAGAPIKLREAYDNRLFKEDMTIQKQREELQEKLITILSGVSLKITFPLVLLDCRICDKIHRIRDACNGR